LVAAARRAGVRDARVLDALAAVPRRTFVPPDDVRAADRDRPIAIGGGQTTSQPSLIAAMVAALELRGDERVLEVGTGFGYQTALLSRLAAEVYSIDRSATLVAQARENLHTAGIEGCVLAVGDGTQGWAEHAPYDAIVVSATAETIPPAYGQQLREGGRLVIPVGPRDASEVVLLRREGDGLRRVRRLTGARFVPLVAGGDPASS
jgi:protein-L-isoaspartate(D-aspartate) O-methyltransferase